MLVWQTASLTRDEARLKVGKQGRRLPRLFSFRAKNTPKNPKTQTNKQTKTQKVSDLCTFTFKISLWKTNIRKCCHTDLHVFRVWNRNTWLGLGAQHSNDQLTGEVRSANSTSHTGTQYKLSVRNVRQHVWVIVGLNYSNACRATRCFFCFWAKNNKKRTC